MLSRASKNGSTDRVPLVALPAPLLQTPQQIAEAPRPAKSARVAPQLAPIPLNTVHVDALGADLLLAGPYSLYRERLEASGIFDEEQLEALRAVTTSESQPFDPNQPVVGIMLNEPSVFGGDGGVGDLCSEMRSLGCRVVLIPPCADLLLPEDPVARVHGMRSMLKQLDSLIGPGGPDVDPAIYGQPNRHSRNVNLRRDRFEADFSLLARSEDLFMFGICRSHQLWNAAAGGKLVQDLEAEGYASGSRNQSKYDIPRDRPLVLRNESGRVVYEKRVHLDPTSRLAGATGRINFLTNAYHHQLVKTAGREHEIVGHSRDPITRRTLPEATERWNAFTVQWHPEAMWNDPVQRRLLSTVARRAALFRAVRQLRESGAPLTAKSIGDWASKRGFSPNPSDNVWIRADLIPHLYGSGVGSFGLTRRMT